MAKKKFADKAEAKKALETAKEESAAAKQELRAFEKENKLEKGGDHSSNKKWSKLNKAYTAKQAEVEEIREALKEVKGPRKERVSKYEYPAEAKTAADKKKWRAKMRAEAKRAEKGDKPAKKKDKASKAEKSEKSEKKSKKEKKEAAAVED
jgi:hypothetical protein